MNNRVTFFLIAGLIGVFSSLANGEQASSVAGKQAVAKKPTPCFSFPADGLLPTAMLGSGDSCVIDSMVTDSNGTGWFHISSGSIIAWVKGSTINFTAQVDTTMHSSLRDSDSDRKRRYRIVRDNPTWTRRIIAAVRDGKICLGMSMEQTVAAWGEPEEKARGFILGIGEYDIWFYASRTGRVLNVSFNDGKVIGWSYNR